MTDDNTWADLSDDERQAFEEAWQAYQMGHHLRDLRIDRQLFLDGWLAHRRMVIESAPSKRGRHLRLVTRHD